MADRRNSVVVAHPLADLFPQVEGEDYEALKRSIANIGLQQPIIVLDGKILDGRARYRACIEVGVDPETRGVPWNTDPTALLMAANLNRRHLTISQKAMIVAKLVNMPGHRPRKGEATSPLSVDAAAKMIGSTERTVQHARMVHNSGNEALIEKAEKGFMAVDLAAKVSKLAPDHQAAILAEPESKAKAMIKAGLRAQREAQLARQIEDVTDELASDPLEYPVILADPPWRFSPWGPGGEDRSAANHYPTMGLADIKAMAPPAAPDAALFLWATAPMMPQALSVMAAWGFEYRSHLVWVKDRVGTGYWARSQHELLLIGSRGMVPAPAPGEQPASVFHAPRGRHSEKPSIVYDIIEQMFPTCHRLEMFARSAEPREGWTHWGAEATVTEGAAA